MNILQELARGRILLMDGAMGTMLLESGLVAGGCPEQLNLTLPDAVAAITRRYADAGADIVQTNSFGGTPNRLAAHNLSESTGLINREAVKIARAAVPANVLVAASCGPTGLPRETPPELVRRQFEQQLSALLAEQPDMVIVETMTNLMEALIALKVCKAVRPGITAAVTVSLTATSNGFQIFDGASVAQITSALLDSGADIIGANCGAGSEQIVAVAREFRKHTATPLLMQPSAGLPFVEYAVLKYPESPQYMARRCHELLGIGVNMVGGCCGATPEHIAAMRRVIDEFAAE
jgi:5-methyltetrahydrofolate--homocysteine methyltransferase